MQARTKPSPALSRVLIDKPDGAYQSSKLGSDTHLRLLLEGDIALLAAAVQVSKPVWEDDCGAVRE
jgi:hypothetical protein